MNNNQTFSIYFPLCTFLFTQNFQNYDVFRYEDFFTYLGGSVEDIDGFCKNIVNNCEAKSKK
jgi:hypothetical protein